jgi:hypothetical protein
MKILEKQNPTILNDLPIIYYSDTDYTFFPRNGRWIYIEAGLDSQGIDIVRMKGGGWVVEKGGYLQPGRYPSRRVAVIAARMG